MAQLLVRNIDERIVLALKRRAAEHGVSAEEEHRRILQETLNGEEVTLNKSFAEHLLAFPECTDEEDDSWMFDRHDPRNASPPGNRKLELKDL